MKNKKDIIIAVLAVIVIADANGEEIAIGDFRQGDTVSVTLKDSFTEETPFYYPAETIVVKKSQRRRYLVILTLENLV